MFTIRSLSSELFNTITATTTMRVAVEKTILTYTYNIWQIIANELCEPIEWVPEEVWNPDGQIFTSFQHSTAYDVSAEAWFVLRKQ